MVTVKSAWAKMMFSKLQQQQTLPLERLPGVFAYWTTGGFRDC